MNKVRAVQYDIWVTWMYEEKEVKSEYFISGNWTVFLVFFREKSWNWPLKLEFWPSKTEFDHGILEFGHGILEFDHQKLKTDHLKINIDHHYFWILWQSVTLPIVSIFKNSTFQKHLETAEYTFFLTAVFCFWKNR